MYAPSFTLPSDSALCLSFASNFPHKRSLASSYMDSPILPYEHEDEDGDHPPGDGALTSDGSSDLESDGGSVVSASSQASVASNACLQESTGMQIVLNISDGSRSRKKSNAKGQGKKPQKKKSQKKTQETLSDLIKRVKEFMQARLKFLLCHASTSSQISDSYTAQ